MDKRKTIVFRTRQEGKYLQLYRVSRQDTNLALQLDALKKYGAVICREQLEALLGMQRPGNMLVVWKFDRRWAGQ